MKSNAYIRARIEVLKKLISTEPEETLRYFRNGYFPDGYNESELVNAELNNGNYSDETLSMKELSSFSSYFVIYPEKIAGTEVQTTSNAFPVKVKGTIENIKKAMGFNVSQDISVLELEAEAVIVALGLGLKI